jgi:glycosyltransferase involved in cell wall biosynthesis
MERFVVAMPRDLRGELGLREDVFLIGFMGRFMAQKGFRYIVDAVDLLRMKDGLPKRPLVLTFGEGAFIREEKQAIEKRGLKNYFCFMPFTPNVADTIKGLDVVAMPSLWEACGLLAMEVLACGTPLIGSDCIGLREVIQGTPAIVITKADAADLARALLQEMEKSSKESFLRYCKTAAGNFDVRKTSQSILNLYDSMTS